MTDADLAELRPGAIIRSRGRKRRERVVVGTGRSSSGRLSVVLLVKVGCSWTDPNPTAAYDACFIRDNFERTGKRAPWTLAQYQRDMECFERGR